MVCKDPISSRDDPGYLGVSIGKTNRIQRERAEWERTGGQQVGETELRMYSPSDLDDYPDPAPWRLEHERCRTLEDDGSLYEIEARRLQSWGQLVDLAAHLFGKQWLPATGWDDLLRYIHKTNNAQKC